MEKTITLDSKIKKYAAVAVGIAGVTNASAQVTYTDVNPDVVLTTSGTTQYILDLDGNAVAELGFVMASGSVSGTYPYAGYNIPYTLNYVGGVAAFGSNAAATNGWMGSSAPSNIAAGASIGSGGSFVQSGGIIGNVQSTYLGAPLNGQYGPYSDGNFLGTEGYVGVRFDISGATHYGWARIEMSADGTTMTIKDYAYDATAGAAINAGDVGGGATAGINDISNEVTIRTVNNNLRVELTNAVNSEIKVTNLSGQNVIAEQMTSNIQVIALDELSTGMYLVNVTNETGTTTKKIYVK